MILEKVYQPGEHGHEYLLSYEYLLIDAEWTHRHIDEILRADKVDIVKDGLVECFKDRRGIDSLPKYWCWHPKTWIEAS